MWCDACQQDVPGISSQEEAGRVCCARCHKPAGTGSGPAFDAATTAIGESRPDSDETASVRSRDFGESLPFDLDDWRFDANLRAAERLCRRVGVTNHSDVTQPRWRTVDPPHAVIPRRHNKIHSPRRSANMPTDPPLKPRRGQRSSVTSLIAWTALSLGLMTLVCGAVLLVWSFADSRADLWRIGLPLTLAGLAALVLGLVLQLDGLWHSSRETSETLDQLDDQLSDLRHATTLLGSTHSSAAKSFYVHMAEGASPELLLADLKGQLDLLAMKMSREHGRP